MDAFWRDRRVFVTGGTGLVGAWTVRTLVERGAHVVTLVRDLPFGSEFFNGRLSDHVDIVHGSIEDYAVVERALAEHEIQTILHLAAQTIVGIANRCPLSTFESNIKGTWCVLEAARRCGLAPEIVVASSDKAYGAQSKLPYTEEAPLLAHHPYDVSKACADMLARTYARTYDLRVAVTRCGNFYGGGDLNWNRIVPGTIRSIIRGERPVLRSDGSMIRDFFYVRDGAEAYLHLAQSLAEHPELAGAAFNFSNELQVTALQMVRRILALMQSPLEPLILDNVRNEIPHQYLSAAKARQVLHWQPKYSLDDGLRETWRWYADFFAESNRRLRPVGMIA